MRGRRRLDIDSCLCAALIDDIDAERRIILLLLTLRR